MDVILPPSSIKIFTSSIVCFSRIAGSSNVGGGAAASQQQQQDIYWEFDPITGLIIRTMNDAKTAYACVSYQPNFFSYCSTNSGTTSATGTTTGKSNSPSQQTLSQNTTTSNSTDSTNNSQRHRNNSAFTCRVTIKALIPIVRHRNNKSIESLRIRTYYNHSSNLGHRSATTAGASRTTNNSIMHQSYPIGLEFIFTLRNDKNDQNQQNNHHHHHPNTFHINLANNNQRLVIHRIPIVDSTSTTTFGNVMNPMMYHDKEEPPSELIVSPFVLSRLLEPLQRTVEVALIVRSHTNSTKHNDDEEGTRGGRITGIPNMPDSVGSVSASSFHHSDTTFDPTLINNNNAILQATTASLLKTETACTSQEFVDFDFITTRRPHRNNNDMPDNVNDEVILVFPIKEARAMLQFCCSCTTTTASSVLSPPPSENVHVSFHWGGQPFMIQTVSHNNNNHHHAENDENALAVSQSSTSSYNMQLVLATMDYQLLTSMRTMTASDAQ